MADNIDVDRVIEEMEAVPHTRERRMILALAYEIQSLKSGGQKKGGQKKSGGQHRASEAGVQGLAQQGTDSEG